MKKKIIISFIIMLIVLLILPFLFIQTAKAHEFMGIIVMLFFVVNPITTAIINSMIGKDIRKMWWMPVLFCIVFLLSYWFVLGEIILDLMFYAVIYLIIGLVFMIGSFVVKLKASKGISLIVFTLILAVLLVVGGVIVYLLNNPVKENVDIQNQIGIQTNTDNNQNKLINLSEAEKKKINKKIDTVEMAYTLGYFESENKTLTEEDMLKIAIFWARVEDKNYKDFGGYDIDNNAERINIDYAKKWVKKVFNKDIILDNNIGNIKKNDKDLLIIDFPTGFGIQIHKMQKLEFNEKTNIYSLYIDELDLTEIEDSSNLIEKFEEIREQIDYSGYKVKKSYVLKYKEVNAQKYIVEIFVIV